MQLDLGDLTFARGGALLVRRALARCLPEETLVVTGHAAELAIDLRAWCRGARDRLERRLRQSPRVSTTGSVRA